ACNTAHHCLPPPSPPRRSSDLGCTPIGPWLVDAADVPDPMTLVLSTSVNGKEAQRGTTRDMVFSIPWLIEYLSAIMTLSPGDIIDRKSTRLNSSHVKNSYAVFC